MIEAARRQTACERRIAELHAELRQARAEADDMLIEAVRACRKARLALDAAQVEINVRDVQDQLDRARPRR